jgi:hypothetical protein
MRARAALLSLLLCAGTTAWAGEVRPVLPKKVPHPHAVHLDLVEQSRPEVTLDEISNWPEFMAGFRARLDILSVSPEVRRLAARARADALTADEKAIVVGEVNRMLALPNAGLRTTAPVPASPETGQAAARHRRTQDPEDLRWLHRNLLGDVLPQLARKVRDPDLRPITCVTCHEGFAPPEGGRGVAPEASGAEERAVGECVARAVATGGPVQECLARAARLRAARIEAVGPLRGVIQRALPDGEIPLYVALRPSDPYPFKPLLKRLVCTECHAHGRTVERVRGRQGEIKGIPLFYGAGFREIRPEDFQGAPAR